MSIISVDTWHLLAKIANTLAQLQDGGELVKIENSSGEVLHGKVPIEN